MLRYKLIQINKIIEPGDNFTTGVNVGKYENLGKDWTKGGPEARVGNTKDLPKDEQISKWFETYGCEAQKGTIKIIAGVFKNNIVFPSGSGISQNEINDYVFASKGEFPIKEIDFQSSD